MLVCEAVTQQRPLYIRLFRGRYLATGLHATIHKVSKAIPVTGTEGP
jgi:hypothetical protein